MTKACCGKLVKMGQICHMSMAKSLLRRPEMRNVNATQLLEKNEKIFYECQHME
ncbi:Prolamin-like domain [Sesbania bispinosa]|nr:Prolamin-like domain [Sesbania bispinosa]